MLYLSDYANFYGKKHRSGRHKSKTKEERTSYVVYKSDKAESNLDKWLKAATIFQKVGNTGSNVANTASRIARLGNKATRSPDQVASGYLGAGLRAKSLIR